MKRWSVDVGEDQMPLVIEDRGTYWRVLGRNNPNKDGRYCILIQKTDGRLLNIGIFFGPEGPPE